MWQLLPPHPNLNVLARSPKHFLAWVSVLLLIWAIAKQTLGLEVIRVKKWQCLVCSFIYDEELGLPEEGLASGTRWDDVPDDWMCPDCGVGKEDFEMVEI